VQITWYIGIITYHLHMLIFLILFANQQHIILLADTMNIGRYASISADISLSALYLQIADNQLICSADYRYLQIWQKISIGNKLLFNFFSPKMYEKYLDFNSSNFILISETKMEMRLDD